MMENAENEDELQMFDRLFKKLMDENKIDKLELLRKIKQGDKGILDDAD